MWLASLCQRGLKIPVFLPKQVRYLLTSHSRNANCYIISSFEEKQQGLLEQFRKHAMCIKTGQARHLTQLQSKPNYTTGYGNTGCGVSRSGIQNPIDFFIKVKCSKGFFDIFLNGMTVSLQNKGQILQNELFKT